MCGIAGFSLSREMADKLDAEKLFALTETAVRCNLHRGKDAVGMFACIPEIEEPHISYWKRPGSGDEHLDYAETWIKELPLIPTSMGIHTRAKSQGFPETDNDNNHPVRYNDVIAIHNGMIRNHSALKLSKGGRLIRNDEVYKTGLPPVDSLAIPMLLDSIPNPLEDIEGLAERLSLLEGGWAFHAAWADHPNVALLVAGPEYPLQIRYSKGRLGYSSEPDAVETMFEDAGLQWSKRNNVRELDPGCFVLVVDGEPYSFGLYDLKRKVYDAKLKALGGSGTAKYIRHVPTDSDTVVDLVPDTAVTKGALNTELAWSSTVVPADKLVCIFTHDKGLIVNDDTKRAFSDLSPTVNPHKFDPKPGGSWASIVEGKTGLEVLVEADTVFYTKAGTDKVLYGWFDQMEIVCNEHGSIAGIYNWERSTIKRFTTEPELKRRNDEAMREKMGSYSPLLHEKKSGFREWLRENSQDSSKGAVKGNIVGGVVYYNKYNNVGGYDTDTGFTFSGEKLSYVEKLETAESFGFDKTRWKGPLPVEYIYEALSHPVISADHAENLDFYFDPRYDVVPFLYNDRCVLHNSKLLTHDKHTAMTCPTFLIATALTIDTFDGIDTYKTVWEEQVGIKIDYSKQPHAWGCKHKWSNSDFIDLELWGLSIKIIYEEKCGNCQSTRVIDRYPDVIGTLMEESNKQEEQMELDTLYAVDSSGTVWSD